jgi:NAD(P)-dependent dehydrogenase (short-subunit alcohol dehydrogenase family)
MKDNKQIALMTGATSGFGQVIAEHLVQQNHTLVFLARSEKKAELLKTSLLSKNPKATIDYVLCDLSSFTSIIDACKQVRKKCNRIDLFIQNAGIMNFEFQESKDNIEETLQVNLLAPMLLFLKLKDLIPRNYESKVLFTASGLHQGKINYDDLEFRKEFSSFNSYRQSKLGVILTTRLLATLPEYTGMSFYSIHPGMVRTELGKNANWLSKAIFYFLGTSLSNGAKTHNWLIDEPNDYLVSGDYYAKSKVSKASEESYNLEEASKLLKVIEKYIDQYLKN